MEKVAAADPQSPERSSREERGDISAGNSETGDKGCSEDHLKLICWNVDGLDGEKQPDRARGLCCYLTSHSADVVFLQELVQPYVRFLKNRLADDYTFIQGGKEQYFTGMMLKKTRIQLLDSEIISYPMSRMLRNLLVAQVLFRGQKFCLMTSHFESCKQNSAERKRQLGVMLQRMRAEPEDAIVLFGGDTNLRDSEVASVGLPSGVTDVFEQLGEPESCRYTWDTQTNTNKRIPGSIRLRFDRIYLRQATGEGVMQLQPDHMTLTGMDRLECGRYTSDHWGIVCCFSAAASELEKQLVD